MVGSGGILMIGVDQIWMEAVRTLEKGKSFALATVINARGSTPREVGAKMLVREDGQFGTIGGGCGEAEVFRKARVLLEEGAGARLAEVDLTGDFEQEQIGTCGGIMDVFIDLWLPDTDLPMAKGMAEAVRRSAPAALLTLIDPGCVAEAPIGARALVNFNVGERFGAAIGLPEAAMDQVTERASKAEPGFLELDEGGRLTPVSRLEPTGAPRFFIDPLAGAQRLIIVGAGHIAQPLSVLGSMLGFHVTVIDDRTSFASRERFPAADEIIAKPFIPAIKSLKLDRNSHVVVVTRGHAFDEKCLRAVLAQQAGFVGMIGSRRRVRATLERIESDGVDRAIIEQVHAPIGLDIGAETPEEIAVAIIGEIIRERRLGARDRFSMGIKLGRLLSKT